MWVCVSELGASLCALLCAFSFPPFTPCISLWILSMYFWNNEHRALLFVFLHQNRALVTEGSSDLGISGFLVGHAARVDSSRSLGMSCGMGWISQQWSGLVLSLAEPRGSRFSFPYFFLFLFFPPPWDAQRRLCLGVDTPGLLIVAQECKDSLPHHQGCLFPDFYPLLSSLIPSPSSPLLPPHLHSPSLPSSSASLRICPRLRWI